MASYVYLPAFHVHVYSKCRHNIIPDPWILWLFWTVQIVSSYHLYNCWWLFSHHFYVFFQHRCDRWEQAMTKSGWWFQFQPIWKKWFCQNGSSSPSPIFFRVKNRHQKSFELKPPQILQVSNPIKKQGDNWMYSYQRTPMGNPYLNPI